MEWGILTLWSQHFNAVIIIILRTVKHYRVSDLTVASWRSFQKYTAINYVHILFSLGRQNSNSIYYIRGRGEHWVAPDEHSQLSGFTLVSFSLNRQLFIFIQYIHIHTHTCVYTVRTHVHFQSDVMMPNKLFALLLSTCLSHI